MTSHMLVSCGVTLYLRIEYKTGMHELEGQNAPKRRGSLSEEELPIAIPPPAPAAPVLLASQATCWTLSDILK